MKDVRELQRQHREAWDGKALVAVVSEGGFHTIHQHSDGGVYPPITYATPEEVVARLAQLLGVTQPVRPQDWPERVQIGSVE